MSWETHESVPATAANVLERQKERSKKRNSFIPLQHLLIQSDLPLESHKQPPLWKEQRLDVGDIATGQAGGGGGVPLQCPSRTT